MSEKNSSTIKLDKNSELRRIRRTKLFFVFLLFLLLILGGIVGFLRKKEFQISTITVSGTKSFDPNLILKAAHTYLDGHYAIIIPKTNTLLLSKTDLSDFITNELPSIKSATITFKEKNSIDISVTEKKPSYVWCNTTCYFVDDTGMIYEESPQFTPGMFMTFSGGTVDENPIKNHFASTATFNEILKTIASLHQMGITILGINLGDDIAIHVDSIKNTVLGKDSQIIITQEESSQNIINALGLLMNDKVFREALATKGHLLQYIDIRFPDKIYYKFDTPATQMTATPPTTNAKLLDKTQ